MLTGHNVLHFITLLDSLLGNDLDSKDLAILLVFREHDLIIFKNGSEWERLQSESRVGGCHLAKAALANDLQEVEVIKGDLVLLVGVVGLGRLTLVIVIRVAGVIENELLDGRAISRFDSKTKKKETKRFKKCSPKNEKYCKPQSHLGVLQHMVNILVKSTASA